MQQKRGSLSCRLPGTCRAEGPPLCEEIIFSVLRRTLQIISSNLSNGPETLLPLSCNGDRWLAVHVGAIQTSKWRGGGTNLWAHTNTCIKGHSLQQWQWLRVIVSSRTVVLAVIRNDHSQRGLLTMNLFTAMMIPLYGVTLEHPTTSSASLNLRAAIKQLLMIKDELDLSVHSSWHVGMWDVDGPDY